MNDLESLLKEREFLKIAKEKKELDVDHITAQTKRLRADSGASLYDLIKMIGKFVALVMPEVTFSPEEEQVIALDKMKKFEKPLITYKLISRENDSELKPRIREEIKVKKDEQDEEKIGYLYGQKFKCLIQFNIFGSVYEEAEQVMDNFEKLIFSYTSYFKRNGVAELIFKKQITDDYYNQLRETLSIRNLIYYVEIEKLTVIFKEKIQEIEALIDAEKSK